MPGKKTTRYARKGKSKAATRPVPPSIKRYVRSTISRSLESGRNEIAVNSTIDSTGTFWDLTLLGQGDGLTQRDGNEITVKRVSFRGSWTKSDTTQICRLLFFVWHPDSAVQVPVQADILTAAGNSAPVSYYEYENRSQFTILADRVVQLETDNVQQLINMSAYGSKMRKVTYNSGANTGCNHIYMYAVADSGVVPHPSLVGAHEVLFKDG